MIDQRRADRAPRGPERPIDGLLRAAAELAAPVLGQRIGTAVHHELIVFYNTPEAFRLSDLATAILDEAVHRGLL